MLSRCLSSWLPLLHQPSCQAGRLMLPVPLAASACISQGCVSATTTGHNSHRTLCSNSGHGSAADSAIADVAIVGGGMVGAALAALLAANPLTRSMRVLLIDQQPQIFEWRAPTFPELRVSTVTPASIRCMERAGAWQQVEQHSTHFGTMQVWDAAGPGCIRWHAEAAGRQSIGAVAENSLLQAALLGALQNSGRLATGPVGLEGLAKIAPGVTCVWPVKLERLQLPPAGPVGQGVTAGRAEGGKGAPSGSGGPVPPPAGSSLAALTFEGEVTVRARLVVAADGAMSRVRALAGLRTWGWAYNQRGLVATVRLKGGGTDTAWQRFLPSGPLALLPVRDGMANVVWSTTADMAARLERATPEEFAAAVNQALAAPPASSQAAGALGSGLASMARGLAQALPNSSDPCQAAPQVEAWVGSAPRSFPLQLKQSGRYVRPRLALIGDAAHAVHPLAGQGVNLGFGDAEALADVLARAVECGGDPGDIIMLQDEYERPRQRSVLAMTSALDALQRVFSVQAAPFAAARNLGLGLLNAAPPVKNQIMKFAMGL